MKVGDYVRTYYGISKIKRIIPMTNLGNNNILQIETEDVLFNGYEGFGYFDINEVKTSPNIIDLIEENDFINGMRIAEIKSNKNGVLKCMVDSDYEFITTILNNEIESVLTKEQFESMEYKVGE